MTLRRAESERGLAYLEALKALLSVTWDDGCWYQKLPTRVRSRRRVWVGSGQFDAFYPEVEVDEDPTPVTLPSLPVRRHLTIEDKYDALFTSATWTLIARVDTFVIDSTVSSSRSHDAQYIERWARYVIRSHYEKLKNLRVDAEAEYVKWGGDPSDL